MTFNAFSTKANKRECKQFVCVLLCFVQVVQNKSLAQRQKQNTDMATIKAIIRATKGKDTAFVRFRISDGRNVQLFYKSPISVKVDLWDAKREEISTRKICNNAYRRTTNNKIQDTKARLFEAYERNKKYIKIQTTLQG